ncbi:hypothetical protein D3C76_407080 [compost metagenome]
MSYQNQRQELGLAGSLADPHSTQDGSKWYHNVGAAEIAKLTKLSAGINEIVEATAKDVAKAQIKVGRLLNEARALIPGDLQFGKWREANTQIGNKSTANKLMNLATMVGDGRITQEMVDALPVSTLKELISAPDSVLIHIRDKLADDQPVTRTTVREAIKETREPVTVEGEHERVEDDMAPEKGADTTPPKAIKPPTAPAQPAGPNPRTVIEIVLELDTIERLKKLDPTKTEPWKGIKPIEWAWLVFGLDTDPSQLPNRQSLLFIERGMDNEVTGQADEERLLSTITRAYDIIRKEY